MPLPSAKTITISLPEYKLGEEPNVLLVGPQLDQLLIDHFLGQVIVLRCIGSQDHPGKTLDELVEILLRTGTDKYDPNRKGVGYAVGLNQGKHIDFYGTAVEVTPDTDIFTTELLTDFYHGALGDRGYAIRIDVVIVYDAASLTRVEHLYGDDVEDSDGFVFNDANDKQGALVRIVKIM